MAQKLPIVLAAAVVLGTGASAPACAQAMRANAGQVHVGAQSALRTFPAGSMETRSDCPLQRVKSKRGVVIVKRTCEIQAD